MGAAISFLNKPILVFLPDRNFLGINELIKSINYAAQKEKSKNQ